MRIKFDANIETMNSILGILERKRLSSKDFEYYVKLTHYAIKKIVRLFLLYRKWGTERVLVRALECRDAEIGKIAYKSLLQGEASGFKLYKRTILKLRKFEESMMPEKGEGD